MSIELRNEKLKNYNAGYKKLRDTVIKLVMDFDRDLQLSPTDHPKYILRNSILYRAESIRFHLDFLLQVFDHFYKECTKLESDKDRETLFIGGEHLMYVFDDIIFNICSMLDYVGNLIGLLYIGRDKMYFKWNGCFKAASDPNNKLGKTSVVPIITKNHKAWIDHLFNYRSRLIHDKRDIANGRKTISFGENKFNIDFEIDAPDLFMKMIKTISNSESDKKPSIVEVAFLISEKSISFSIDLFEKSCEELIPQFRERLDKLFQQYKLEHPEKFNT